MLTSKTPLQTSEAPVAAFPSQLPEVTWTHGQRTLGLLMKYFASSTPCDPQSPLREVRRAGIFLKLLFHEKVSEKKRDKTPL